MRFNPASLKTLREKSGLSAYALARLAGVNHGYLCDIERGKKRPGVDVAGRLASALAAKLRGRPKPKTVLGRMFEP